MRIGIIAAMSSEYKQVAQLLEDKIEHTEGIYTYTEGRIKNNTIIRDMLGTFVGDSITTDRHCNCADAV